MTSVDRIFIYLAAAFVACEFLGEAYWFQAWYPFDTVMHFAFGFLLSLRLLTWWKKFHGTDGSKMWVATYFVLVAGAAWEAFEMFVDGIHGSPLMVKGGWPDTGMDMFADIAGAIVACGIWLLGRTYMIMPRLKFPVKVIVTENLDGSGFESAKDHDRFVKKMDGMFIF